MNSCRILVVHPEPTALALLGSMLQSLGHTIVEAPNDRIAVRKLEREGADMVLAGADPDDGDALELLCYVRRKHPGVPFLLMFPMVHPERTRDALRMGATGVLRYPVPANELRAAITQALEPRLADVAHASRAEANGHNGNGHGHGHGEGNGHAQHQARPAPNYPAEPAAPAQPKPQPRAQHGAEHAGGSPARGRADGPTIVGADPALRQAVDLAAAIASSPTPVLIEGERGTGKTLLARAIHENGPRRGRPFLALACAALGDTMFERELFGHRVGGSADPDAVRPGALALAQGGTVFLDDLSSLSPSVQMQLVRVLRDGEYVPVGAAQPVKADVRFIFASGEDLGSLVEQGRFRADLYYRIGVVRLKLPPLRHRGDDVERLAQHFLARFVQEFGKAMTGFSPEALEALRLHDWPGNVQELESVIQRAVANGSAARIGAGDLLPALSKERPGRAVSYGPKAAPSRDIRPLKEALEEPEKQIIIAALRALNWNRQETARVLDINRTTLYKKMKKYGLLIDEVACVN